MIRPPVNLVMEIPSYEDDCPLSCRHCIHQNMQQSAYPYISDNKIVEIIHQGKQLGIDHLNIYPHNGDITISKKSQIKEYMKIGSELGLKIKSITSGVNFIGLEILLPYINKLAVSLDSLDEKLYCHLRSKKNYHNLLTTIDLLKSTKKTNSELYLTALVLVNKQTIHHIDKTIEDIFQLQLFDKIKIMEILPIGRANTIWNDVLDKKDYLDRLAKLRKHYFEQYNYLIGTPSWRIKNNSKGCRLGIKDLVIGPHGELAGCTLLLYLNRFIGNIHHHDSLSDAWDNIFGVYRQKENTDVSDHCLRCQFYENNLCWGGCLARNIIFGKKKELIRSCGLKNKKSQKRLFDLYQRTSINNEKVPFPINLNHSLAEELLTDEVIGDVCSSITS